MSHRWCSAIGIALLGVVLVAPGAMAGGWSSPERVGAYGDATMVVMPGGVVHAVARGPDGLFHLVRRTAGGWTRSRLTQDTAVEEDGFLVVRQAEWPWVARDPANGSLGLAYRLSVFDGSTGGCGGGQVVRRYVDREWLPAEDVTPLEGCAGQASIASRYGLLFLGISLWRAYGMIQNGALMWEARDGWHSRLLQPSDADELDGPDDPVVVVDAQRRASIAWSMPGAVRFAVMPAPGERLVRERIAFTATRPGSIAMRLAPSGRPWVAWLTPGSVSVARRLPDGTWTVERLSRSARDLDLVIDGDGRPHLLLAQGAQGVHHAWRTAAGTWRFERLDTRSSARLGGLDIDRTGRLTAIWQHGRTDGSPVLWLSRR
jgi:hypothetical protein